MTASGQTFALGLLLGIAVGLALVALVLARQVAAVEAGLRVVQLVCPGLAQEDPL